jgi:hypothetical protein
MDTKRLTRGFTHSGTMLRQYLSYREELLSVLTVGSAPAGEATRGIGQTWARE